MIYSDWNYIVQGRASSCCIFTNIYSRFLGLGASNWFSCFSSVKKIQCLCNCILFVTKYFLLNSKILTISNTWVSCCLHSVMKTWLISFQIAWKDIKSCNPSFNKTLLNFCFVAITSKSYTSGISKLRELFLLKLALSFQTTNYHKVNEV